MFAALLASPLSAEAVHYKIGGGVKAVHVREGPSNRTPIIGFLTAPSVVAAIGECQRNWCRIAFRDEEGWVYRPYLKETNDPLLIVGGEEGGESAASDEEPSADEALLHAAPKPPATTVSIQGSPGAGKPLIGLIPSGAKKIVDLNQCVQGWCRIRYQDIEGWAPSSFLKRPDGTTPPDTMAALPENERAVNQGEETGTLPAGAAQSPSQQAAKDAPPTAGPFRVTNIDLTGELALYDRAGGKAKKIGAIPSYATDIVAIGPCGPDWCNIRYLGLTGWVDTGFLAPESAPRAAN
jgi:SH3-like domain-containing protein